MSSRSFAVRLVTTARIQKAAQIHDECNIDHAQSCHIQSTQARRPKKVIVQLPGVNQWMLLTHVVRPRNFFGKTSYRVLLAPLPATCWDYRATDAFSDCVTQASNKVINRCQVSRPTFCYLFGTTSGGVREAPPPDVKHYLQQ